MSIVVQCPHCHARSSAPDQLAGRSAACPECGRKFTVGEDSDSATLTTADEPRGAATGGTASTTADEDQEYFGQQESRGDVHGAVGAALGLADVDYDPDHVAFGEGKQRVEGEMDMTPMVDVTFLLLIFFMVTAAFSLQKSLPVPTPTETTDPSLKAQPQDQEEDRDFVIIHVDAHNTYRVITVDWEREAPSEQEMLIQLREARRGDSKGTIPSRLLVRANGDAEHQKVVAALDAGSEVGMEEIQLQKVEEDE